MSLTIGMNPTVLRMLFNIGNLESERSATMTRLATGKRINKAEDDPTGVVALAALKGDLTQVDAAIENNERSKAVLDTADTTLQEVSKLILEIQSSVNSATDPNATTAQIAAYQSTVDQSLDTIDSLINNTQFNGKALFTGSNAITATSGTPARIFDVHMFSMDPNVAGNTSISVTINSGVATLSVNGGTVVNLGTVANGDEVSFSADGFSGRFTVISAANATTVLTVTNGGGATFQLGADTTTQTSLDLGAGVLTTELGDAVAGYLSTLRSGQANDLSSANLATALSITTKAAGQVSISQSRVGTFSKFQVGAALRTLEASKEGMTSAISAIEDTDFAEDTAKLDRQDILLQAAVSMLARANVSQTNVLALLQ